jgi:hypothetical protein
MRVTNKSNQNQINSTAGVAESKSGSTKIFGKWGLYFTK